MKKNNVIIIVVATLILSGVIGFFIGKLTQNKSQSASVSPFGNFGMNRFDRSGNRQNSNSQNAGQSQNNNMNGPQQVVGEILSQDDKSITVKMTDGSSKIIFFNDTTAINKSSVATKTDLKVGEKVAVFGPTNSDGSVTANNIQLNPQIKTNQ